MNRIHFAYNNLLVAWPLDVGSAAGCEAGLCPAVYLLKKLGYAPGMAFGPNGWAEPKPGA